LIRRQPADAIDIAAANDWLMLRYDTSFTPASRTIAILQRYAEATGSQAAEPPLLPPHSRDCAASQVSISSKIRTSAAKIRPHLLLIQPFHWLY